MILLILRFAAFRLHAAAHVDALRQGDRDPFITREGTGRHDLRIPAASLRQALRIDLELFRASAARPDLLAAMPIEFSGRAHSPVQPVNLFPQLLVFCCAALTLAWTNSMLSGCHSARSAGAFIHLSTETVSFVQPILQQANLQASRVGKQIQSTERPRHALNPLLLSRRKRQ